jgi:hypothetical protein
LNSKSSIPRLENLIFMLRACFGLRASDFVLLTLLVAGCGGGSGSVVTGAVSYEGEPVAKGQITFTPADGKGPIAGDDIVAGKYRVVDLAPGQKIVQITAVDDSAPILSSADMAKAAASGKPAAPPPKVLVPPDAVGNGATVEVKAGSQTHDFTLKKPAGQ